MKDDEFDISAVTDTINTSTDLEIGLNGPFPVDGFIDEICISETVRSPDWINTSYLNQRYPSMFCNVGAVESVGAGGPMVSDETPGNGSTNVELNPTLQARVIDFEDDSVSWYIMSNSSGSWLTVDSGTLSSGNGYVSTTPTTMDAYDTTYYWSVNVTDPLGSGEWLNVTYHFSTTFAPAPWWDSNWQYRKVIIVDHNQVEANSALSNFPVLVSLTDTNISDHAQFDGDDLVFTDYAGNRLHHEIEFYDGNHGQLVAWVNVTSLSGDEDTKVYLYYGNPSCGNQEHISDVWDAGYRMVQHLPHNWILNEDFSWDGGRWHSVFEVNGTYYAYYDDAGNNISRSLSPDGINWTRDTANNPIISGLDCRVPWAWYENETFYVMYGASNIYLATSSDGVNFTKYPNNTDPQPVITGVEAWSVMKVGDTYYQYFVDNGCSGMGGRCVGVATSTDLISWTKYAGNPIFSTGVSEPDANGQFNSDVFTYGGDYYILIPHYTAGSDYAGIELWRDSSPLFNESTREYLGFVLPCPHTVTDQDTPAVLTDTVHRNSYDITGGELWTYHQASGTDLSISPSIPQALKGAMRDSTVFGNHGVGDGVGGPTPDFCKIGGGYNFDGLDEYMVVEDDSSLDLDDAFSVEVWIRLGTALVDQPNEFAGVLSKVDDGSGYGLCFNCSDEVLVVAIGGDRVFVDVSGFDWMEWHQIVVGFDGSIVKTYIDKVLISSESVDGSIGVNDVDLWIGDLVQDGGNVTDGFVDEIRLSDYVRDWKWFNTSYNNQNNPVGFLVIGDEESVIPSVYHFDVSLSDEWNLISVPVNETISKDDFMVNVGGVNMSWQEAVNDSVIIGFIYDWNESGQNYGFTDTLAPGQGYWMYAYDDCDLWITGNANDDDYITGLLEEWNLVGIPYDSPVAKDNLTIYYSGTNYSWQDAVNSNIIIGFIYDWNETGQNYGFTDVLNSGEGYWMYAYESCVLRKEVE